MSFAPNQDILKGASRRFWAIVATGVVHCVVLLIVLVPTSAANLSARVPNLVTFDSANAAPAPPAVPQSKQPKIVPPQLVQLEAVRPPLIEISVVTPQVLSLLEQADAQAAAGGCDLTAPVQAALQSSAAVQQELPRIPAERRSVANAIAIWNADWIKPDAQLEPQVLDTIRTAIVTTIAAASEACRVQPQGGPRLIYLPVSGSATGDTTILALGSGAWTWQQIADTAQPELLNEQPDALAQSDLPRVAGQLLSHFQTASFP